MDNQGITADKKTAFDLKFFIKWGIAVGVPCILYFAVPQSEAVSPEMRKFFVCTSWAILTWAMNLLPVYISEKQQYRGRHHVCRFRGGNCTILAVFICK